MNKTISRIIGFVMLVIAVVFVLFAFNHPEMSFSVGAPITYLLYGVYGCIMMVFLIAPALKK